MNCRLFYMMLLIGLNAGVLSAQPSTISRRDTLIQAANELINEARFGALITLDSTGHPQSRTMDAFPVADDMIVWLATNVQSRKVREIKNDPRVTLYFPVEQGYVSLIGEAHLVDDSVSKETYWKKEWAEFYPKKEEMYMLIKVIPKRVEIVSYKHGIVSEAPDWKAPVILFE